jgi:hypothetical protein
MFALKMLDTDVFNGSLFFKWHQAAISFISSWHDMVLR